MSISGKLFGSTGQFFPICSASVPVTARPGYGAWYADKIARAYATRSHTGSTIGIIGDALLAA